jgi:hypothetical protein
VNPEHFVGLQECELASICFPFAFLSRSLQKSVHIAARAGGYFHLWGVLSLSPHSYKNLVLAAGRAAHGQKIAVLGFTISSEDSNYWQLDCQSGIAPDFSKKDPLGVYSYLRPQGVSPNRRFQLQKGSQPSSARTTKRFPSTRWASATQMVCPRQSTVETEPQTPTGFAEIVSDDFPILHKGTRFLPTVALPIRSEILHGDCVDVLFDFDAGRQKK